MAMASWADAMTASLEGASTGFLDDLKVAIEARDKRAIAWDNETNSMRRDLRHFEGIALPTPRTPAETVVSNNTAEQRIAPYAGPSTKAVLRHSSGIYTCHSLSALSRPSVGSARSDAGAAAIHAVAASAVPTSLPQYLPNAVRVDSWLHAQAPVPGVRSCGPTAMSIASASMGSAVVMHAPASALKHVRGGLTAPPPFSAPVALGSIASVERPELRVSAPAAASVTLAALLVPSFAVGAPPSHEAGAEPSVSGIAEEVVKRAVAAGFAPTNFSQYLYQFQSSLVPDAMVKLLGYKSLEVTLKIISRRVAKLSESYDAAHMDLSKPRQSRSAANALPIAQPSHTSGSGTSASGAIDLTEIDETLSFDDEVALVKGAGDRARTNGDGVSAVADEVIRVAIAARIVPKDFVNFFKDHSNEFLRNTRLAQRADPNRDVTRAIGVRVRALDDVDCASAALKSQRGDRRAPPRKG